MNHVGIEKPITIDGKTYRLSRFTRRLLRRWFEWANSQLIHPLDLAEQYLAIMPEHAEIIICAAEAMCRLRFSMSDPALSALFNSDEGVRFAFVLLFEKFHPDIDVPAVDRSVMDRCIAEAAGIPPLDVLVVENDYLQSLGLIDVQVRESNPPDWAELDRTMFRELGLTPAEVDEMTLTEINVCLRDAPEVSVDDALQLARLHTLLTPAQLLELARRKSI